MCKLIYCALSVQINSLERDKCEVIYRDEDNYKAPKRLSLNDTNGDRDKYISDCMNYMPVKYIHICTSLYVCKRIQ